MTYEPKNLFVQAELEIVSTSTTERKTMSTKTSFKRIALVAVAALTAGVLTSVSANAAVARTATGAATATVQAATATQALGTVTLSSNLLFGGSDTIAVSSLTGPAGGTITVATIGGSTIDTTASANVVTVGSTATLKATTADSTSGAFVGQVSLPGSYVMTLAGGATLTLTVTGQRNSIAPLVGDGFSKTAANATNGTTLNGVAGSFNTVTVGLVSGTGAWPAGGNTAGTSGARTMVTVSGAGATITSSTNATVAADKLSAVSSTANMTFASNPGAIVINTPSVGTVTVNSYLETANGSGLFSSTPDQTVTVTVAATASANAVSASLSTATMTASGTGVLSSDALSLSGASTGNATIGSINVLPVAASGSLQSSTVYTLSITGPGILVVTNATTNGTGRSLTETTADADWNVAIKGDGSTGKSTVTITSGSWTVTRSVTFFGSASKLVATQVLKIASNAGATLGSTASATAAAATVVSTDSSGNPVSGVTPTVVSSDTSVIANGTCSASDSTGTSFCSVTSAAATSGKTANVTFKTTVNSVDVVSNALVYTLGGAITSYKIAFDKSAYTPGEKMTLTITGVGSLGLPTFDGTKDIFDGTATTGITTSASVTNDWTIAVGTGVDFVGGVAKLTIYAPLVAGPFAATVDVASGFESAVGASTLTATTSIVAASDSVTALINSLIKKINDLSKLVAKIQKKLGVK